MCLHGRKAGQPHGASVRPQSSNEGSVFMTQLLPRCHHIGDWVSVDKFYGNTDIQDIAVGL